MNKYYVMYTCENGIDLLEDGRRFYVWTKLDISYSDRNYKIKVPASSVLEYDEDGLPDRVIAEGVEIIDEEEDCN